MIVMLPPLVVTGNNSDFFLYLLVGLVSTILFMLINSAKDEGDRIDFIFSRKKKIILIALCLFTAFIFIDLWDYTCSISHLMPIP